MTSLLRPSDSARLDLTLGPPPLRTFAGVPLASAPPDLALTDLIPTTQGRRHDYHHTRP
jgi:hypothetical protein